MASSDSPASQSSDNNSSNFPSTAAYLEHLSTIVMKDHYSSTYAILREHLSPDFEQSDASIHNVAFPPSSNLEEHLINTDAFKKMQPNWKMSIFNVSANLLKGANTAEVWMSFRGSDDEESTMLNRESVSILHWRRRTEDGKWVCYRHTGLRGSGNLFG